MKPTVFLAGSLLLLTSVASAEETPDPANGKKLFNESRCLSCHGVDIFTSKDRKVKDLAGLESKVRLCDSSLSINWFDDQILDVVAYLNQAFYKFKQPGQGQAADAESGTAAQPEPTAALTTKE